MKYKLLYDNPSEDIFTRLLHIRKIDDNIETFLNPTYKDYRIDVWKLPNIRKAINRITQAIKQNEKIMIFGDYDVDGICSSYIMYTFFQRFLGYRNISIRLPHRTKDGYGIKSYHLEEIKKLGCSLVITVDNGITAIQEAEYAKEIGLDLIITDHHKVVNQIPNALAVVNPQIDKNYPFPEICGAMVSFKVCIALAEHKKIDMKTKKNMLNHLVPFVAIATISDIMPLIKENRLIVKHGLRLMNTKKDQIDPSLKQFLEKLNIKNDIDTYHCGFIIGPRLNASGRIDDALEGLKVFLSSQTQKQNKQIEKLEQLNTKRKKIQEEMFKEAKKLVNHDKILLVAQSEKFHEGIVGIVAGRLTEQYYKPSLILRIDNNKKQAIGSLRGPEYFNVVEMLKTADDLLLRYGGHAQAGGMTVDLENLEKVIERFHDYAQQFEEEQKGEKTIFVDTKIYHHELSYELSKQIQKFGPYGEANPEPLFQLDNVFITHASTVGKGSRTHLKLQCTLGNTSFTVLQRGSGDKIDTIPKNTPLTIIGKIKADNFNGGFYVEGICLEFSEVS